MYTLRKRKNDDLRYRKNNNNSSTNFDENVKKLI